MRDDRKWERTIYNINENMMETIVKSWIFVPKDLFFLFLVPIANGSKIDVWIQGTKVGGNWFFHDGAQMPTDLNALCPLILTITVDEYIFEQTGGQHFPVWTWFQLRGTLFFANNTASLLYIGKSVKHKYD